MNIDASLPLIQIDDVVQITNQDFSSREPWIDYASIKDDRDRKQALLNVQYGRGRYRIVRKGLNACVVLTY